VDRALPEEARGIERGSVTEALRHPDRVIKGSPRTGYQKRFGKKLLRIVTEGNILITVYMTTRIAKYTEER
jgi:hypothetical protein